jgi:septal ring factor EnvC (AmiA/AmiB activator)
MQKAHQTADGIGSAQMLLLETDLQAAPLRINELESQNARQNKRLRAAKKELARLQAENEQAQSEIGDLRMANDNSTREKEELEAKLNDLSSR